MTSSSECLKVIYYGSEILLILPLFLSIGAKLSVGQKYERERFNMGCFLGLFLPSLTTVKEG